MNVRLERMNKITLFYVMDLIGEEIPFFTMDNEAVIFIDRRCKSHFIVCIVNKMRAPGQESDSLLTP